MTDLKEFANVIDGYKLRQVEVLTRPLRPGVQETRYKIMYHALAEGQVCNEIEGAKLLGLDVKGRPFRRFLLEFRRRLFAPLLFLDTENSSNFNPTQKANFECLRKLATFQTLVYRHCPENACILAKAIIELAIQNDVTLVALEMATFLKRYYVERVPDLEQYLYYQACVERLRLDWVAENKAMESYQAVIAPAVKFKSTQLQISKRAQALVESLSLYKERCNTIIFVSGYYATRYIGEMARFHWHDAIAVCDEAIRSLNDKLCTSPRIMAVFKVHKVICLTMLDRYAEALSLNSEVIQAEIEGSRNWFLYLDNQLLVSLKASKYKSAYEAATKIYSNRSFATMPESIKESWTLLAAYLILADRNESINRAIQLEKVLNFRLNKFLNQVPNYSKDKKGLNVPILIAQFLFLLQAKDFDQAHDKLIALRKYRVKHFNAEDGYYRTQLFIRMLCSVAGTAFNKKLFLKKTADMIKTVTQIPKGHPDQHFKIEIIPYEILWQWVANCLD